MIGAEETKIPRVLFVFWTGTDRMSRARKGALKTLQQRSGLGVEVIGPHSLDQWVRTDQPLHPAYEYLSSTHRSDYLRSYFMYNFGGAYSDVKPVNWDWRSYLDSLESDSQDIDFYGSPETSEGSIAGDEALKKQWQYLVSNCAFIFRPGSEFAQEWNLRVNQVLDMHLGRLRDHPGTYHPRAVASGIHAYSWKDWNRAPRGYPLRWAEIQGEIFHQLQSERLGSFRAALPALDFGRYR